jgi:two-component system, chemotaxis family, chemotaxis protein CheY
MTRALVVDDSAAIRSEVSKTLTSRGFQVLEAEDGLDAYAKLKANSDVDFIITDQNMPNMNGLEFLQKVKGDKDLSARKFPIIMLTTEFAQELKDQGKQNGVRVWLVKPYRQELLLNAVERLLSEKTAKAA